jgi:hypothetical protein
MPRTYRAQRQPGLRVLGRFVLPDSPAAPHLGTVLLSGEPRSPSSFPVHNRGTSCHHYYSALKPLRRYRLEGGDSASTALRYRRKKCTSLKTTTQALFWGCRQMASFPSSSRARRLVGRLAPSNRPVRILCHIHNWSNVVQIDVSLLRQCVRRSYLLLCR